MGAKNKKKKQRKKIQKKKTAGRKKYFFEKPIKVFGIGAIALFSLYLVLGLVLGLVFDSRFLRNDLKEKYGKVLGAMNVSVLVRGMPIKPVISSSSGCSGAYPYINLDWADDLGVDTFDVYRDGALLIAGVTASSYQDSNVTALASYSYYVIANGPVGTKQSDSVTVQAAECYTPPPPPPQATIIIESIDNITNLPGFYCLPKTKKKRPVFSGTANIGNGQISAEIRMQKKGRKVLSNFSANSNGFWQWRSQGKLKKGYGTIYITVIDPADSTRTASASLRFRVTSKKMSNRKIRRCRLATLKKQFFNVMPQEISPGPQLKIQDQSKVVHSGESIGYTFSDRGFECRNPDHSCRLEILDEKGDLVRTETLTFGKGENFGGLRANKELSPGDYKLMARFLAGDSDVGAEDGFTIKEKPILVLGSEIEITYAKLISKLGWLALFTILILGSMLFLLFVEYQLSKRALVQITGQDLKRKYMID